MVLVVLSCMLCAITTNKILIHLIHFLQVWLRHHKFEDGVPAYLSSSGACPTNGISIKFEIRSKFGAL